MQKICYFSVVYTEKQKQAYSIFAQEFIVFNSYRLNKMKLCELFICCNAAKLSKYLSGKLLILIQILREEH